MRLNWKGDTQALTVALPKYIPKRPELLLKTKFPSASNAVLRELIASLSSPFRTVTMASNGDKDLNSQPQWPVKTRELQNHHFDTRIWNNFSFRDDDIMISTWAKSGTTWMQQIIAQLIFSGPDEGCPCDRSPWLDLRIAANQATVDMLEAQTHRRFIKTHAPIDTIVYSPQAKYIFIGRDGRDVMWSMHNHFVHGTPEYYRLINDTPGRVGLAFERPPADPAQFFREFLERPADPRRTHSPFWGYIRGWWDARLLPNVMVVHFNDLKADLEGEIRRIAKFLEIEVPEEKWPDVVDHSSFEYMKKNAGRLTGAIAELVFEGGGDTLINKGSNGRWKDLLTKEEIREYEERAKLELGEECARWLANGGHLARP